VKVLLPLLVVLLFFACKSENFDTKTFVPNKADTLLYGSWHVSYYQVGKVNYEFMHLLQRVTFFPFNHGEMGEHKISFSWLIKDKKLFVTTGPKLGDEFPIISDGIYSISPLKPNSLDLWLTDSIGNQYHLFKASN
jgi:hypothetical protein